MPCEAHTIAATYNLLTAEDVDLIQELVRMRILPDAEIIDLGVAHGTSAISALTADPSARVCSIDHEHGPIAQIMEDNLYGERWRGIVADSVEAADDIPFGTEIGLLLLDTSHEKEQTLRELRAWWPHLHPGAMIWIHDYEGEHAGIREAVAELEAIGRIEVWKQSGLGIAVQKRGG